jgi:peptidoglycan/xylan/chitin deacetylase (PgdA/CDA1 family)
VKILTIFFLIVVLFLTAGFSEGENIPFLTSAQLSEHGVFHVQASFPLTENEMVNAEIYNHVRREIDGFKQLTEGGRLEIGYVTRQYSRRLVGFTVHARGYTAEGVLAANNISGMAFDLQSGSRLELSDIFEGDFLWRFDALGIPVDSSFRYFAFDTENLYIYLQGEITIPLTHFGNVFAAEYEAEQALPRPPAPESPAIDAAIRDWHQVNEHEAADFPLDASNPPGWRQSEVALDMFKDIFEEQGTREGGKFIALTFDDGPERVVTTRILDMLAEYGAKATFFVLGHRISAMSDIIERMHREGHQVGNHSFDHRQLNAISASRMEWQITETNRLIEEITGTRVNLLRPPFGETNARVNEFARSLDMAIITWDIDPRDWANQNSAYLAEHIISRAQDGSIILLHDTFPSSADAAETVVRELTARGFTFGTVEELINMNAGLVPGLVFRNGRSGGR